MKKIFLIVYLLFIQFLPSISLGSNDKVYYCIEEGKVGFNPKNNYKSSTFKVKRYKVLINFDRKFIKSKTIFFGNSKDVCKIVEDNMFCSNFLGSSFSINKNTLKYFYSSIWIDKDPTDIIEVVHGRCEVF